jgi:regulator of sigma E protease
MISFLITILQMVIILGFMIFIHELGHYLAAVALGIPVEEFGLGYPPKMLSLFKWRGTEFTLNWIPFGGFVRPRGEDDPDVEGGIESQKPWKRLIVLISGVVMNLLMGILVFAILFSQTGAMEVRGILVSEVFEQSAAMQAGLMAEDVILAVNDEPMDDMDRIISVIDNNPNQELLLEIERGDEILTLTAVPRPDENGFGKLGVAITYDATPVPITFFEALGYSVRTVGEMIQLTLRVPAMLIAGQISPEEARVSGPIGIGQMLEQAREVDIAAAQSGQSNAFFANTLWLVGAIAVGLGFANLLPLPALDGGRIVFVLFEWIFGKRLSPRLESLVHGIGFILIIALSVLVAVNDIVNPINLPF